MISRLIDRELYIERRERKSKSSTAQNIHNRETNQQLNSNDPRTDDLQSHSGIDTESALPLRVAPQKITMDRKPLLVHSSALSDNLRLTKDQEHDIVQEDSLYQDQPTRNRVAEFTHLLQPTTHLESKNKGQNSDKANEGKLSKSPRPEHGRENQTENNPNQRTKDEPSGNSNKPRARPKSRWEEDDDDRE